MGSKTTTIIRRSIFSFLQNYQYLTSTPSLLALPFAISTLASQSLVSSSPLFPIIHQRLRSIFLAAGLPPSSQLFSILNLKLSQTILSSLFISPFTFSFLLLAKSSIIKSHKLPQGSWILLFYPLLTTQLCNTLLMLTANSTSFFLLALSFNFLDVLGLSSPHLILLLSAFGAIIYSFILANAYIISNLALISSGMEKQSGFIAVLKACVLIQGRTATALSLAVPLNLGLAAIEALFHLRILHRDIPPNGAMIIEAMLIAYLYALLLVLDTVVGCVFWKSCKTEDRIEMEELDRKFCAKSKGLEIV